MKQMKNTYLKTLYILFTFVALLCSSSCHLPMSAEAFLSDFSRDRDAAEQRYGDKDIILAGPATTPRENENGDIYFGLIAGDRIDQSVMCYFDRGAPQVREELLSIKPGERVEVKCRLRNLQLIKGTVFMEKCQLLWSSRVDHYRWL